MDTMVADLHGPLFPNVGSGVMRNLASMDAPLWFFWSLQQYIKFTGDSKTVKKRYLGKMKGIIDGYRSGTDFNIHMLDNGLVYGGQEGIALTWMDAVNSDGPVTPRIGCPVEINALWYNALCFYYELTQEEEIKDLSEKVKNPSLKYFGMRKKVIWQIMLTANIKIGLSGQVWLLLLHYLIHHWKKAK
jgi:predicted glycogen debranching enzyme